MSTTRREFIKTVGAAMAAAPLLSPELAPLQAAAVPKRKVIYDQDTYGPFGTDILGTLMMLQAENVDLLGITIVSGDDWMKQELAYTLRLLEMLGRPEIPVYPGAEF